MVGPRSFLYNQGVERGGDSTQQGTYVWNHDTGPCHTLTWLLKTPPLCCLFELLINYACTCFQWSTGLNLALFLACFSLWVGVCRFMNHNSRQLRCTCTGPSRNYKVWTWPVKNGVFITQLQVSQRAPMSTNQLALFGQGSNMPIATKKHIRHAEIHIGYMRLHTLGVQIGSSWNVWPGSQWSQLWERPCLDVQCMRERKQKQMARNMYDLSAPWFYQRGLWEYTLYLCHLRSCRTCQLLAMYIQPCQKNEKQNRNKTGNELIWPVYKRNCLFCIQIKHATCQFFVIHREN